MSVSLILIPTALGIAAAIGGTGIAGAISQSAKADAASGGSPGQQEQQATPIDVHTRMKDPTLLGVALEDLGALGVIVDGDRIAGRVDGVRLQMHREPDGIWGAHLEAEDGRELDPAEAADLMTRLDSAYARRVQQAVAARIRQRADGAGFDLVSETRGEDDSVTMVLNVREPR